MAIAIVHVRRWGNSKSVVIPSELATELRLRVGDIFRVEPDGDALRFERVILTRKGKADADSQSDITGARR